VNSVKLFFKKDNTERSLSSNAFERVTVRGRDLQVSNSSTSALVLDKSSIRDDLNCVVMHRGEDKKLFPCLKSRVTLFFSKMTFLDPASFELNILDSLHGDMKNKQRGEFGETL
jgi:hypothetical protein